MKGFAECTEKPGGNHQSAGNGGLLPRKPGKSPVFWAACSKLERNHENEKQNNVRNGHSQRCDFNFRLGSGAYGTAGHAAARTTDEPAPAGDSTHGAGKSVRAQCGESDGAESRKSGCAEPLADASDTAPRGGGITAPGRGRATGGLARGAAARSVGEYWRAGELRLGRL